MWKEDVVSHLEQERNCHRVLCSKHEVWSYCNFVISERFWKFLIQFHKTRIHLLNLPLLCTLVEIMVYFRTHLDFFSCWTELFSFLSEFRRIKILLTKYLSLPRLVQYVLQYFRPVMFCFQPNNNLLNELKFLLLPNLTTCLWSLFLYAREIHL